MNDTIALGEVDMASVADAKQKKPNTRIKGVKEKDERRWVLATYQEPANSIAESPLPVNVNEVHAEFHADEPMLTPFYIVKAAHDGFVGLHKDNQEMRRRDFKEAHYNFNVQELNEEFQSDKGVLEFKHLNPDIRDATAIRKKK